MPVTYTYSCRLQQICQRSHESSFSSCYKLHLQLQLYLLALTDVPLLSMQCSMETSIITDMKYDPYTHNYENKKACQERLANCKTTNLLLRLSYSHKDLASFTSTKNEHFQIFSKVLLHWNSSEHRRRNIVPQAEYVLIW